MTSDRWPKRACLEVALRGRQRAAVGAGQGRGHDLAPLRHDVLLRADRRRAAGRDRRAAHGRVREALVRPHHRWTASSPPATPCSCRPNGASGVRGGARDAPTSCASARRWTRCCASSRSRSWPTARAPQRIGARRRARRAAEAVEPVARAVANSPLVKTALHGADPNFGRILQAAGQVWPPGDGFVVDLEIEGRLVVSAGESVVDDLREQSSRWSRLRRTRGGVRAHAARARAARPRSSSATCRRST